MTLLEQASALLAEDGPLYPGTGQGAGCFVRTSRGEKRRICWGSLGGRHVAADEEALHFMTTFEDDA